MATLNQQYVDAFIGCHEGDPLSTPQLAVQAAGGRVGEVESCSHKNRAAGSSLHAALPIPPSQEQIFPIASRQQGPAEEDDKGLDEARAHYQLRIAEVASRCLRQAIKADGTLAEGV